MTTPVVTSEVQHVLNDYRLHLTGHDDDSSTTTSHHESSTLLTQNPPNWPTDRHRIPPYRPINRNLNREERPRGGNPVEIAFITIMFTGVFLNASMAKLWGMTGGAYFPELFKYAVGGEW